MKKHILCKLKNIPLFAKLMEDKRYRIIFFAGMSLLLNLVYAIYNLVLGIMDGSVWFITMCVYYVILGLMRFFAVSASRRGNRRREYGEMLRTGVFFVILSIVLASITYISLSKNTAVKHGTIVMITIAAYTFCKITMSVIRAVKRRRAGSPLVYVISNIGYAEVAVSIATMQRSMIVSFDGMSTVDALIMNTFTSSAVFLFILTMGIFMIRKGYSNNGKVKDSQSIR